MRLLDDLLLPLLASLCPYLLVVQYLLLDLEERVELALAEVRGGVLVAAEDLGQDARRHRRRHYSVGFRAVLVLGLEAVLQ